MSPPHSGAPGAATADAPLISVVTAVYNGKRFLEETFASVRAQTYAPIEHWVIDGGSTDGTVDLIRGHEARLAGWISEPDAGIADAFNKGVARARGEYILFLNADDAFARPAALADLIEAARTHDWPDVVYGDITIHDGESGALMYRVGEPYSRARLLDGNVLTHPSMLMHRRYFEKFGSFDTTYRVCMDYDLFLRGIPDLGALHVDAVITRMRSGGVSVRQRAWVVDEVIRALRGHGYLGAAGAMRLRLRYAARRWARKGLEITGLYGAFNALRFRKT